MIPRFLKDGTLFGVYEKGEVSSSSIKVTTEIHNDLLPKNDHSNAQGGHLEKLKDIIQKLKLSHLNEKQRTALHKIVLNNDPLLLLEEGELGKINPPHLKQCSWP